MSGVGAAEKCAPERVKQSMHEPYTRKIIYHKRHEITHMYDGCVPITQDSRNDMYIDTDTPNFECDYYSHLFT